MWQQTMEMKKNVAPFEGQSDIIYDSFISRVEIYKAFWLDVAQGHMKGAPNETRTHLWMLLSTNASYDITGFEWQ